MGSFTFNLPTGGLTSTGTSINTNLYKNTKDEELIYTGADTIVWDRVNEERLRRNLPSLTDIGYPRPPEDTEAAAAGAQTGATSNATASTFEVKGPPGMTFEQAKAIFDKQASTGSLVGLKAGDTLSAATQAAAGLQSAISALGQQASGIIGALGSGISSAAGQIGSLANKAIAGATSIANKAISAVKGVFSSSTPTNGIDIANYAKQATALAPIGGLSTAETTGVLAQTKKLVGQAADKLTDNKGAGSYGFDLQQLEAAGYVKPGTSSFVSTGLNKVSSVLKSPSVFTGKDGITDIKGFLSSSSTQDKTQQSLMAQGAAGLKSIGVSLSSLGSAGSAGLLTSAAKSLSNTEAFVKGLPLPANVSSEINKNISEGAFAVNLTNTKVPPPFKEETTPEPAADTTNRATVNAASDRVIGNDKIPKPDYGPSTASGTTVNDVLAAFNKVNIEISTTFAKLKDVETQLLALESQATVSQSDWELVEAQYQIVKSEFNNSTIRADATVLYNGAPSDVQATTRALLNNLLSRIANLLEYNSKIKAKLAELAKKIQ